MAGPVEHNQAMHRMPKPSLRSGCVNGDSGRYGSDADSQEPQLDHSAS